MIGTTGEIITFYSYKGGTGRSMALSNVACLLAERQSKGRGVLMIDWDLEAPGLHNFFQNRFKIPAKVFEEKPGLIDLFLKIDAKTPESIPANEEEAEKIAYDALDSIDLDDFIVETNVDYLNLLKAGIFDSNYSNKVNSFKWESLHNRSPLLIRLFAEKLAEKYRYVLIDSRTGYTDISGICTMLMPEKLVVVFTPNRQNYTGIKELVKMALKYRRKSDDLRPLLVFPLPSRIEFSIDELRRNWRFGKPDQDIEGFQPIFENLFKEVYELNECNLKEYFDEVQIQQNPYYAYGEEIAVIAKKMGDELTDRFTITESFRIFTNWLVNSAAPWGQKEKIGEIFLSYAQGDRAKAQAIAESLEQQGFSVWWDRSILPGIKFDEVTEKKINAAKCVIVLWSKDSVESEEVQNEAFVGAKNQTLIPILIDDVMPPLLFRERQTANLINWEENVQNDNFDRLLKSIKKILGGMKEGHGDKQGIASKLDQLAIIDMNKGEYEAARQKFQELLDIKQQIKDRYGEAGVWYQLAIIDMNQGEVDAARQKFQKSLEIKQQIGDREGVAGAYNQLATIDMTQGEYKLANDYYERALSIYKEMYGEKHSNVASSLYNIGKAWDKLGEYQKAIEYYERALSIVKELVGENHYMVATILNNIGLLCHNLGEYQKALEYHKLALSVIKEVYGEKHPNLATCLNNVGAAWDGLGEYQKAIEYYERALSIVKELYGEKHPDIARSFNNIGSAWNNLGEYKKALDYYEQALSIYKEVYGEKHPDIARSFNNIGSAWDNLGEYKKALDYYERSISIAKEFYGEKHPDVATNLNNIGKTWNNLGEYKKALDYYERALSIVKELYGEKHPYAAKSLNNIGNAWNKLGEYKKALDYYERALSIVKELYGEKHSDIAKSFINIGSAWNNLGEFKKALDYYERSLSIVKEFYGEKHPDVATSLNNIGKTWYNLGEYKKALEFHERALSIVKELYGEKHPYAAKSLNNIGNAWNKLGEYKKALDYYERALSIYKDVYAERHPDMATCLNNIGEAWDNLGESKKALDYYEKAYDIFQEFYGDDHPYTIATKKRLIN